MDISALFPQFREAGLIEALQKEGTLHTVEEGTMLMDIGQFIKHMPLVLEGSIKIMREDEDANELLLYYLEGGHTCAMSLTCCMQQERSKIRAIAETDCQLLMIPVQFMDSWMSTYPSWREFILNTYASRFENLLNAVDALAFYELDQRLLKYLEEKAAQKKTKELHTTHQQIAYDLNSSREVISRLLKKLEKNGLVKLGRNMVELVSA